MINVTRSDVEYILECLNNYQDEGPVPNGWRSDKLIEFIDKLEGAVEHETDK